jgi:hypothetical protein
VRRREFITLLGGAATSIARPLPLAAQQSGRTYRIGLLGGALDSGVMARGYPALRDELRKRGFIVDETLRYRLPAMFIFKYYVDAGGLMSYGVDITSNFRRLAEYVAKILNGAKPADLPVEQPTKFELAVNLKTAKALGLELPTSLLLRADEVIE